MAWSSQSDGSHGVRPGSTWLIVWAMLAVGAMLTIATAVYERQEQSRPTPIAQVTAQVLSVRREQLRGQPADYVATVRYQLGGEAATGQVTYNRAVKVGDQVQVVVDHYTDSGPELYPATEHENPYLAAEIMGGVVALGALAAGLARARARHTRTAMPAPRPVETADDTGLGAQMQKIDAA